MGFHPHSCWILLLQLLIQRQTIHEVINTYLQSVKPPPPAGFGLGAIIRRPSFETKDADGLVWPEAQAFVLAVTLASPAATELKMEA